MTVAVAYGKHTQILPDFSRRNFLTKHPSSLTCHLSFFLLTPHRRWKLFTKSFAVFHAATTTALKIGWQARENKFMSSLSAKINISMLVEWQAAEAEIAQGMSFHSDNL